MITDRTADPSSNKIQCISFYDSRVVFEGDVVAISRRLSNHMQDPLLVHLVDGNDGGGGVSFIGGVSVNAGIGVVVVVMVIVAVVVLLLVVGGELECENCVHQLKLLLTRALRM